MLQVARLAPQLLQQSTENVESFVRSRQAPEGGFQDRAGKADLYYTVFGLACLESLQAELPLDDLHLAVDVHRKQGLLRRSWDGHRDVRLELLARLGEEALQVQLYAFALLPEAILARMLVLDHTRNAQEGRLDLAKVTMIVALLPL